MFQAGRFICGLGIGVLVTVCPMYLSEMAPPAHRGWLVGHHAIFLVFGYMLSSWLGYACYYATSANPSFAWRFPLAMQCLWPTVLLVASFWIPRSPRWLLQKGHRDEAWMVLQRLRGSLADPEDLIAKEEFYQTQQQLAMDSTKLAKLGVSPWTAVMKVKSYRKRMIVGFLIQWGAEFGGPLVIVCLRGATHRKLLPAHPLTIMQNNYLVILFTNLGQTGAMPLLLSAVWLSTAGA
jgi:MFS family permease